MAITVECDGCGKQYKIDERAAGKKVRCKNCGAAIKVAPAPSPVALPAIEEEDPLDALAAMERQAAYAAYTAPAYASPPAYAPPPVSTSPRVYAPPPRTVGYAPAAQRAPGRYGRNTGGTAVGTDSLTPWLIIGYVITQFAAAIDTTYKASDAPGSHTQIMTTIWTMAILNLVLFFAVLGPSIYLGVFIMSKIFRCPMVELPYFRGCGVAAVPTLMVVLALLLPSNLVLIIVVVAAIIPVMFFALRFVFDLDWVGALVSFAFAGALYLIFQVISITILFAAQKSPTLAAPNVAVNSPFGTTSPQASSNTNGPTAPPEDFAAHRLDNLRDRVLALNGEANSRSRESLQNAYASAYNELESLRGEKGQDPAFAAVVENLKTLKAATDAAPSERPGDEIRHPPPATETWTPNGLETELGDEVAFKAYSFRPLKSAVLDLSAADDAAGAMEWRVSRHSFAQFKIYLTPNTHSSQLQPWTPTKPFQSPEAVAGDVFAVDARGGSVSYGRINDLPFTRVVAGTFSKAIKYVTLDGGNWITLEISGHGDDAQLAGLLEASARTFRKTPAGTVVRNVYSPEEMVPRLADDSSHAAVLLRRSGPAAEPALVAGLQSPDRRVQLESAVLLEELATPRSIPALKEAAASTKNREMVSAVRIALHRLDPGHFNEISDALADLDSAGTFGKSEVLEKIAATKPDDAHRLAVVTKALETLSSKDSFFTGEAAAKVLMAWANDARIVPELLPLLEERGDGGRRRAAMKVLAKLKDKRAVIPVLRWLLRDTDNTVQSLKEMGPMVEPDVAVHLRDKEPEARLNAARILQAVGTPKSYEALNRAAHDPRDISAKEAAQAALDSIKERFPARPATAPAP